MAFKGVVCEPGCKISGRGSRPDNPDCRGFYLSVHFIKWQQTQRSIEINRLVVEVVGSLDVGVLDSNFQHDVYRISSDFRGILSFWFAMRVFAELRMIYVTCLI
jgi:hypothetical protein